MSDSSTPTPPGIGSLDQKLTAPDGKVQDDSSKLRIFLSILKKFIGVSDMAAVRFSLPAQLLEPVPNLEYWQYLDQPEMFAKIGDSDDEMERMLACLRFWFTKDLKYVNGRPCKPYNSTLGEFFRCEWVVGHDNEAPPKVEHAERTDVEPDAAGRSPVDSGAQTNEEKGKPYRVYYLTEQTSHHPPVSAFFYDCPQKGVTARGYDQLSAKFTGTSVRVTPGNFNEGIYINLEKRDNEEYQLTHPAAYLGGFIRGNLAVTVADTCSVTCKKTGLKVVLHYLDESYFSKTQNKVEGVIFRCDVEQDNKLRIKDVSHEDILARIDGSWTEKVYLTLGSTEFKKVPEKDRVLLLDLSPLTAAPKICPPPDDQLPNESRRFWRPVSEAIIAKQYSVATDRKTELEERQRERAAERKESGVTWKPRFFIGATEPKGRPELSEDGKAVMKGMQAQNYRIAEPGEYGAL